MYLTPESFQASINKMQCCRSILVGSIWAKPYLCWIQTDPTHPGLTYLNWFETYWGLVSELSLIWAWSKLQRRSKQGFWPYPNQDRDAKPQSGTSSTSCTFKIKIESQNSAYGFTKDQWPYPNQYQDAKPQSGTSSVLQSPKWGPKGHGCSLHPQNQDREPKFGSWVYQWPVTISKSRSRCKTPVRNLQRPPKPQIRT